MDNRSVIVRFMRAEDAAGVVELAVALAAAVSDPKPEITPEDLIRDSAEPNSWFRCLIAEVAGELVGYTTLCRGYEAHTGRKRLWIGDLYVRPMERRSGVARRLIAAVARHALELGCDAVYWELWRANASGAGFFEKLGAEEAKDVAIMRLDKRRLLTL